jgi:hypothetical protein
MCPCGESEFLEFMDVSKQQSYQEAMALLLACWSLLALQLMWMSF